MQRAQAQRIERGCSAVFKEKNMKRKLSHWPGVLTTVSVLAFAFSAVSAQTPTGLKGTIHGHVTNPVGTAQTVGSVSLSTDGGRTSKYTFPVDGNGDYKGEAAVGTYTVIFRQPDTPPDKMVDSFENVKIEPAADTLQDVDMSRKAFVDKMTPEQLKSLEELKKHNSEALKANEVIKNLNADLKVTTQDIKDADAASATARQQLGASAAKADVDAKTAEIKKAKYTEIETLMKKDTAAKPDASILWLQLAQAQAGLKEYDDATVNFKKALDLENAAKQPKPAVIGAIDSGLGEIYARTMKVQEAKDAYDAAAKINPTQAGFYYKNEAVIFFQSNQPDPQVAAADQAIAATPDVALLYYLKGNGLVGKTAEDPKTHQLVAPPGCMEAYQKYLELDPNGPYAADVKAILSSFGQKIDSTYKAPKKKS